ncbi:SulP family inorganic anion transporter [Haladaptatus sp. R4]|uniref:SulP family inorganic anion transporter n=1 Tax=Haladaptatus sp. R4 TaxID=1679489 RepID=UPI002100771A|nr:SulP family inorganic anion transporter [Haladaptatus sp. R4]
MVLLATGLLAVTNLEERGVEIVGNIPNGLPPLSIPTLTAGTLPDLLPVALALFLLSYVEGMSAVETFARRHDDSVDANQELLADGLTNLAAGIGHGFVVGGSMSRSALNDEVGGKTQLTSGVAAVAITLVLLFLTDLFATLPETVLALRRRRRRLGTRRRVGTQAHLPHRQAGVRHGRVRVLGVLFFGMLSACSSASSSRSSSSWRGQPTRTRLRWAGFRGRTSSAT